MSLQKEIIKELGVKPIIDPKNEIRVSVDFLKDYLKRNSFLKSFVLGISGGQDSSLAGRLAQLAITELREETNENYQFIAVRLPYGTQADEADAQKALAFIQPDVSLAVNIKPAVDGQVAALEEADVAISDFNKGNIKARQRMITQYAIAGANSGAVIGTDHAAENITGFFTNDLPMLQFVPNSVAMGNSMKELFPYCAHRTADLEDDKPLVADEAALGVSYDEIDDYLEGKTISQKSQEVIENWWVKGQHKRHLPITVFDDFWK